MKKLTKNLITTGILGLTLAGNIASASLDFNDMKFYVGAGTDYNTYKINEKEIDELNIPFKKNKKGFGVAVPSVGLKFNDYFGIEAGYSFNKKISYKGHRPGITQEPIGLIPVGTPVNISIALNTKVRNAYLDLMGYFPVDKIDLIGGIGIGRLMAKPISTVASVSGAGITETEHHSSKIKNKNNWRLKAGVQFNVIDNLNLRVLGVYQKVKNKVKDDNDIFISNMKSIGISATYTF